MSDGVPDKPQEVEDIIRDAAGKLETDDALTILFIQVGRDASATAYLRKLDDGIKGIKFDIVDVKTIEEAEQFASTTDLIVAAIAG